MIKSDMNITMTFYNTSKYIITLAEYFKSDPNENCPANQVIDTKSKCEAAADALDLMYMNLNSNPPSDYPAGCYYKTYFGYFNQLTNPSQTKPQNFNSNGGLCMGISKHCFEFIYFYQVLVL